MAPFPVRSLPLRIISMGFPWQSYRYSVTRPLLSALYSIPFFIIARSLPFHTSIAGICLSIVAGRKLDKPTEIDVDSSTTYKIANACSIAFSANFLVEFCVSNNGYVNPGLNLGAASFCWLTASSIELQINLNKSKQKPASFLSE